MAWWLNEYVALLVTVLVVFYLYLKNLNTYFTKRGVKQLDPMLILGNFSDMTLRRRHIVYSLQELYNAFPGDRFIGVYQFLSPCVLLRDTELIKQVTVKEFDHFVDHRTFGDDIVESLFGKSLIALRGQKWRDMRATLSPCFTGSKMKNMCSFISECSLQMVSFIKGKCEAKNTKDGKLYAELEARDLLTRLATDVIASTAFGLQSDSFCKDENQFYHMGARVSSFTNWQNIKVIIALTVPRVSKFFKMDIFDQTATSFFKTIVYETMKHREENNIVRPDMIHLLMETKKGTLKHEAQTAPADAGFATVEESSVGKEVSERKWTDEELAAQAFLFFFAGFDTVSTTMCFLLHELALNEEVQSKLKDEIDSYINDHGQEVTYEALQKFKYMDMVISESFRKWPAVVSIDRLCTKSMDLNPPFEGGKPYKIPKGQVVFIPVHALHHDPQYWSNPDKFDPERFSEENKQKINPSTYLPFGAGPRNCIGSRLALIEIKIMLFHTLAAFDITVCPRTSNPIKLVAKSFNLKCEGGFWLRFQQRNLCA